MKVVVAIAIAMRTDRFWWESINQTVSVSPEKFDPMLIMRPHSIFL